MPVLHICENICALYLANDERMKKGLEDGTEHQYRHLIVLRKLGCFVIIDLHLKVLVNFKVAAHRQQILYFFFLPELLTMFFFIQDCF